MINSHHRLNEFFQNPLKRISIFIIGLQFFRGLQYQSLCRMRFFQPASNIFIPAWGFVLITAGHRVDFKGIFFTPSFDKSVCFGMDETTTHAHCVATAHRNFLVKIALPNFSHFWSRSCFTSSCRDGPLPCPKIVLGKKRMYPLSPLTGKRSPPNRDVAGRA